MNTLSTDAGLTAINANKVKSNMDKFFETNEMQVTINRMVKNAKGDPVKVKNEAGKMVNKTTEEQSVPMCRNFPQVYLASAIETMLGMMFSDAAKEAGTNKKGNKEINRHCVKRAIKNNKDLKMLLYAAMTEYNKEENYDNVTVVSLANLDNMMEEGTVLTKKCRFFVRYLVGHFFNRMTNGCFACIEANDRKSVTSTDMDNVARALLSGSLLTKCQKNAKEAVIAAEAAAKERAANKTEEAGDGKKKKVAKAKAPAKGKGAKAKAPAKKAKKDDDEDEAAEAEDEVVADDGEEEGADEEADAAPAKKAPAKKAKAPVKRAAA